MTKTMVGWLMMVALVARPATAQISTELKPETLREFQSYVDSAESVMEKRISGERPFFWLDENTGQKAKARSGEIVVHQIEGDVIDVAKGLIHHWIGAVFIPRGDIEKLVDLLQDFDRHEQIYAEVLEAELLGREGDIVRSRMKTRKKYVLEVVLDMELEAHYQEMSDRRYVVRSYTTRVREVKNAGTPKESVLPDGKGTGFLWRLYSYWRLEQADDGIFVELETVSLTRNIPWGLGYVIKPFIRAVPQESMVTTLHAFRSALAN